MSQGLAYQAGLKYLTDQVPGLDPLPETLRWRGKFYQWSKGHYQSVADEQIETGLTKWLARNPGARSDAEGKIKPVNRTFVQNAMLAIRSEVAIPDELTPGSWIEETPAGAVGPFLSTTRGIIDLGKPSTSTAVFSASASAGAAPRATASPRPTSAATTSTSRCSRPARSPSSRPRATTGWA